MITRSGEIPPRSMGEGLIRRNMCVGDRMMLCRFTMKAGARVPLHSHPHEQTGYCISGSFEFTVGDTVTTVRAGDAWMVPGNTPHTADFHEDCELVEAFCPVREDYL